MSKSNHSIALILTTLIVIGLFSLTGAILWFGSKLQSNPTARSTSNSTLNQVALESDRNVNYSPLKDDLSRQDWRSADRETYERLLEVAGPQSQAQGFTTASEMETLSCKDLHTVDRLWSAASMGQFGFSTQQQILKALGDYRKMYDQVGWQKLSGEWLIEWTYNPQTRRLDYKPGKEPNFTSPPPGHLPTVERGYNFNVSLDAALKRCNL